MITAMPKKVSKAKHGHWTGTRQDMSTGKILILFNGPLCFFSWGDYSIHFSNVSQRSRTKALLCGPCSQVGGERGSAFLTTFSLVEFILKKILRRISLRTRPHAWVGYPAKRQLFLTTVRLLESIQGKVSEGRVSIMSGRIST